MFVIQCWNCCEGATTVINPIISWFLDSQSHLQPTIIARLILSFFPFTLARVDQTIALVRRSKRRPPAMFVRVRRRDGIDVSIESSMSLLRFWLRLSVEAQILGDFKFRSLISSGLTSFKTGDRYNYNLKLFGLIIFNPPSKQ